MGGMYSTSSQVFEGIFHLGLICFSVMLSLSLRFDLFFQPSLRLVFGSAGFVWFSAGSQWGGLLLCTTTKEVHTWKSAGLRVCVCACGECVHWSSGMLPTWFACEQAETQHSSGSTPPNRLD